MTKPHRRAHLVMWLIVAPMALGALVLGVLARPSVDPSVGIGEQASEVTE
ncbi:MAG: hypothetical protein AAGI30_10850 [Planctomycetota bacterium]